MAIELASLDQESVALAVTDLLASTGRADRLEVIETWRTRNSAFWRFRARRSGPSIGSIDVVFKVERRWTPETAEATFDALRRLSDLPGPAKGIEFPEPLGWTEEPPGVLMPHVDGEELFDVLSDPDHLPWGDPDRLAGVVRSCGEAVGWIHGLASIETVSDEIRAQALQRLPATIRWALPRGVALGSRSLVRSHNFSRNDFLVSADGVLSVLDPPTLGKPALLHEDLAWFTFQMLSRAAPGQRRQLRTAFLEGYASTGPRGPLTPADLRAVAVCEIARALGTSKRLLMKGNLAEGFQTLKIALSAAARLPLT